MWAPGNPRTGRRLRKEPVIALFDLTTNMLLAMLGSSARQAALAEQHREREHAQLQGLGRRLPHRDGTGARRRPAEADATPPGFRQDGRQPAPAGDGGKTSTSTQRWQTKREHARLPGAGVGHSIAHLILKTAIGRRRDEGLFGHIDISGSGMAAERLRMEVTAGNLANARLDPGRERPALPAPAVILQDSSPSFGPVLGGGAGRRASSQDPSPARACTTPPNPDADSPWLRDAAERRLR